MSDIQQMIAESVNRIFADQVDARVVDAAESGVWPEGLWRTVEEHGFTQVLETEDGEEPTAKWTHAYPVFHALGFHRVPLPLAETIIARGLLSQMRLPALDGALTIIQQHPGDALAMTVDQGRVRVQGTCTGVPWARFASAFVIAGSADGASVLALVGKDAAGITVEHAANMGREPRDKVHFDRSIATAFARCDGALPESPVILYGALARAAMLAGAAQAVLQHSVHYANERIQFGKPIGKFQAIQQSLATLAGKVTAAQTATVAAVEAAQAAPRAFDVAVAKIQAGLAGGLAANIGHQVHGAIGFTYEHSLHYLTRRIWSWRAEYGSESAWAERLGREAIAAGGRAFWEDLVAKQAVGV